MKFLVTGGAGFIGSHIADDLLKAKKGQVVVFDNLSVGKKEDLPEGCKLIKGDIRKKDEILKAMDNVDIVFHNAAFVSIRGSFDKDKLKQELDTNCTGTLNVLESAAESSAKKIIFASSMAVYGEPPNPIVKESDKVMPLSPYGLSKLRGEAYCSIFNKHFGINYVCLRYFNTYGMGQTPSHYVGVTTAFIKQALEGKPLTICGDGSQTRDFVSVHDITKANMLAAFSDANGIFNIGSGKETSVNQIAERIIDIVGGSRKHISNPPGEIKSICADIKRAKRVLGYKPTGSILEDLPELIELWKSKLGSII